MAGRKRRIRGPLGIRHNVPRDKTILQIARYLDRIGRGATPHELARKATTRIQSQDNFSECLEEISKMKWVDRVPVGERMSSYTISARGKEAVEELKDLMEKKRPLSDLNIFQFED